nr:hypothetical protein BaRGS_024048 [Batillaria attramentaria]
MDRMQRRYDTELQTLLKDTKEEKQSMQHQQQLRLQSVQKEIDELHKHYTGRLRFLEDDTKEEKKRMRQRHETMLRKNDKD